jgi:hypothetical protein
VPSPYDDACILDGATGRPKFHVPEELPTFDRVKIGLTTFVCVAYYWLRWVLRWVTCPRTASLHLRPLSSPIRWEDHHTIRQGTKPRLGMSCGHVVKLSIINFAIWVLLFPSSVGHTLLAPVSPKIRSVHFGQSPLAFKLVQHAHSIINPTVGVLHDS